MHLARGEKHCPAHSRTGGDSLHCEPLGVRFSDSVLGELLTWQLLWHTCGTRQASAPTLRAQC